MDRAEKEITLIYNGITNKYKVWRTVYSIKVLDCRNLKDVKMHPYSSTDRLIGTMYYCNIRKAVGNDKAVIFYRRDKIYIIDNKSLINVMNNYDMYDRYLGRYDLFNETSIEAFMHLLQIIKSLENNKLTVIDKNSVDDKQLWNLINMMY